MSALSAQICLECAILPVLQLAHASSCTHVLNRLPINHILTLTLTVTLTLTIKPSLPG